MSKNQWYPVRRLVHLNGGLKAINNPGAKVSLAPSTIDLKTAQFNLPTYKSLLAILNSLKFKIIGVDYYSHPEQISGIYPPEWYSYGRLMTASNLIKDPALSWSNIAFQAERERKYHLADISRRIRFQLKACEVRLRDISQAYNQELTSICRKCDFNDGNHFKSLNTFDIYLAIHSYLYESCSLRNYFAEYISLFVFKNYPDVNIFTMANLRKKILKSEYTSDDFANKLYQATDPKTGWIAKLGHYRDLIVHYVPLPQASNYSYLLQKSVNIDMDKKLPSIMLPLPDNPLEIMGIRNNNSHLTSKEKDQEEFIEKIKQNLMESLNQTDALEYCSYSMEKLMELSTD